MKVLIWTDVFPTFSETFIRDHITGLIDRDLDVFIFSSKKNKSNIEALNGYESYNLLDKVFTEKDYLPQSFLKRVILALIILIKSFFSLKLLFYIRVLNYSRFKKKAISLRYFFLLNFIIKNNIKVVHAHFGTNGRKLVFLKQIKYPVKLITTFHGYDIRIEKSYARIFYKDLFYYSDAIISISNFNKGKLLSFGLDESKIVSINNGVKLPVKPASFISKANTCVEILSVGRLVKDKNYKLAIESLRLLKQNQPKLKFLYHIIGGGSLLSELQQQVEDYELEKHIKFYGEKPSMFVFQMLNKCHFLLLSSINEALPTVILEGQSVGLPILATNVGSIKDLVRKENGILVEPNIESFYEGVIQMIAMRNSWTSLGMKGRLQISDHYNQDHQIDRLVEIYKNNGNG